MRSADCRLYRPPWRNAHLSVARGGRNDVDNDRCLLGHNALTELAEAIGAAVLGLEYLLNHFNSLIFAPPDFGDTELVDDERLTRYADEGYTRLYESQERLRALIGQLPPRATGPKRQNGDVWIVELLAELEIACNPLRCVPGDAESLHAADALFKESPDRGTRAFRQTMDALRNDLLPIHESFTIAKLYANILLSETAAGNPQDRAADAKAPDKTTTDIPDQMVTLLQMASTVNKSKAALEKIKGKLPRPKIKGGDGKASEWLWSDVRPILAECFDRPGLPEVWPADRYRRR